MRILEVRVGFADHELGPMADRPMPIAWRGDTIVSSVGDPAAWARLWAWAAMQDAWRRPSLRTWWAAVRAEWRSAMADARAM